MGSIALDNGESVYIHDGSGSADPVAISAAEGSSLAALMAKRERFDFTWANSSERSAQTGMVQGSRGYQEDTRTEYIYDGGAWRQTPGYVEFDASDQTMAAGSIQQMTGFVVNASRSTDTSVATWSTNHFVLAAAGVYALHFNAYQTASSAPAWFAMDTTGIWNPGGTTPLAIQPTIQNMGSVTAIHRATAANTSIYLWHNNATACTLQQQTMRITRLG